MRWLKRSICLMGFVAAPVWAASTSTSTTTTTTTTDKARQQQMMQLHGDGYRGQALYDELNQEQERATDYKDRDFTAGDPMNMAPPSGQGNTHAATSLQARPTRK